MLESHELTKEFPDLKEAIEVLRTNNERFAKLCDEYRQLDQEILSIEQNVEAVSDVYAEDLKKKRVLLKDELYKMAQASRA